MGPSPTQIIIILVVVLIVFGAGKLPKVMGDVGKGIRSMKEGLKGEEDEPEKEIEKKTKKKASSKKEASDSKDA